MQGLFEEEVHRRHQRKVVGEFYRRSTKSLDSIVGEMSAAVRERFPKGRRLDRAGLSGLFSSIDSMVTEGMVSVARRLDERQATRTRPKGEAFEAMYVVAVWEETEAAMRPMAFRLHSLRAYGTRKKVMLVARPLPLQFSKHAAARFYDRGIRPEEAAATLGSYVHDWSLVPAMGEDSLAIAGAARLAVPGPSGGLLLGSHDRTAAVPAGVRVTFDQFGGRMETLPASATEPALYTVNTYVSDAELRPEQADYRRCLRMWRDACGGSYEAALAERTWPEREIAEGPGLSVPEAFEEAIGMLVSHPEALRAAGNVAREWPYATPVPQRHSSKSNSSQNLTHSA